MKWLEIIEIRSASTNRELLESHLHRLMNEINRRAKKQTIKVYSQATIDTDFSIHLFHDSKTVEKNGSQLYFHLVSTLKEFGLINQSIWMEMTVKESKNE